MLNVDEGRQPRPKGQRQPIPREGPPCRVRMRWGHSAECLPWHAEVHIDEGSRVFVREWYAVDCEDFRELLSSANDQL
jgi:hypothetical protein